jgi:glycyl-tRNA synthetase
MNSTLTMEKLVSLCKRRGYIFPSSEIYGGLASAWDYGPLGIELKKRLQDCWWREMTQLHENIVGLDAAILMHPRVWEASGHVENFTDPLVDCKQCKLRFRADQVDEAKLTARECPSCGGPLTDPRSFNLMFKTHIGPVEDDASAIYLRPETAQGSYVNFRNILQSSRLKVPFGIAQVGKAFRNEITTKSFIFRTCEFEQMEMQYFVHPSEDEKWFEYWKQKRLDYYFDLGIRKEKLRFHQHGPKELAHYCKTAFDIEYEYPFGWQEMEGIHNRTDYDLSRHAEFSGKDMTYLDESRNERYIPYIVETAVGLTRSVLVILCDAYDEEEVEGETRVVLRIHPRLSPVTAGIFPLVKKDGLPEIAREITEELKKEHAVFYDQGGAIGRRYRRQDEIGTPYCLTVDYQTKEDETITLRLRDSMEQVRIKISDIGSRIREEMRSYKRVGE